MFKEVENKIENQVENQLKVKVIQSKKKNITQENYLYVNLVL